MLVLHGRHVSVLVRVPSGRPLPQEDGGVGAVPLPRAVLRPRLAQVLLVQTAVAALLLQGQDGSPRRFWVPAGLGAGHGALRRVGAAVSVTKLVLRTETR